MKKSILHNNCQGVAFRRTSNVVGQLVAVFPAVDAFIVMFAVGRSVIECKIRVVCFTHFIQTTSWWDSFQNEEISYFYFAYWYEKTSPLRESDRIVIELSGFVRFWFSGRRLYLLALQEKVSSCFDYTFSFENWTARVGRCQAKNRWRM